MEKVRNKAEGYILVEAVLGIITFTLLSMAFMTIFSGSFNQLAAARVAAQAQQYAELDAELLRLVNYEYLDDDSVLAEYSLHTTRGAIQSVSDAGSWQDEIVIGNETYTADGETNKYRIATINVYRNSADTLPRASLEVPLSSQASGIPIGSVITWPTEVEPTYGGEWLECNGQEVPYKYTALRKLMTHVPDYRGMFLRGYGSQSYSQENGFLNGNTSTAYTSSNIGTVQGDAVRRQHAMTQKIFFWDENNEMASDIVAPGWGGWQSFDDRHWGHFNDSSSSPVYYNTHPKHLEYDFHIETDSHEAVGEFVKSISITPVVREGGMSDYIILNSRLASLGEDNAATVPTSEEIRPVNVAVKFYIKAR